MSFFCRSFIGQGTPAQSPDTNRVRRQVFVLLCATVEGPARGGRDGDRSRWGRVLEHYRRIQRIVRGHPTLSKITITLLDTNKKVLSDW